MEEEHTSYPQIQVTKLAEDPSVFSQLVIGAVAHWLIELSQYRPVATVHPVPPHKQGALFDVAPLVCVQTGAATHRQKSELTMKHD